VEVEVEVAEQVVAEQVVAEQMEQAGSSELTVSTSKVPYWL